MVPVLRRVLPSALTFLGLVFAFWSLVLTGEGRFEAAAWLVFVAALLDAFDGALARMLGVVSAFGRQLDSLVDLVAAGVAPAFLVHQVYFESWGFIGTLVATSWVGFVAARLARYNTSPALDSMHFVGVPCPIAATVVAQYVVFSRATFDDDGQAWVAAMIIAVLGLLMLSNVPYWKSATLLPGQFTKHPYGPGVVVTAVSSVLFPEQALLFWVSLSFVVAVVVYAAGRPGVTGVDAEVIVTLNRPRTE